VAGAPETGGGPSRSGPEIKRIDRAAVARICSGQVVVDLPTAVKELVGHVGGLFSRGDERDA
jgi:hypothetical protein